MKTLFAALLLLAAGFAQAGQLVDLQVLDRSTGRVLQTWWHQGKLYVAGTPGNRYAVRLINKSGGRLLSVVSVDGVNAVSGQTADTSQAGYVLSSGASAEIAGWRKNMDEVAAFYFTSVADSYAGRTDRPQNVGVIGVAVFREYTPPRVQESWLESRAEAENSAAAKGAMSDAAPAAAPTSPAPRAAAKASEAGRDSLGRQAAAEPKLGTGHGERITARTETTTFRRASDQAAEIISIYYDSRPNLVARGIIPMPRYSQPRPFPEPFPGGFVPDPKS